MIRFKSTNGALILWSNQVRHHLILQQPILEHEFKSWQMHFCICREKPQKMAQTLKARFLAFGLSLAPASIVVATEEWTRDRSVTRFDVRLLAPFPDSPHLPPRVLCHPTRSPLSPTRVISVGQAIWNAWCPQDPALPLLLFLDIQLDLSHAALWKWGPSEVTVYYAPEELLLFQFTQAEVWSPILRVWRYHRGDIKSNRALVIVLGCNEQEFNVIDSGFNSVSL